MMNSYDKIETQYTRTDTPQISFIFHDKFSSHPDEIRKIPCQKQCRVLWSVIFVAVTM